VSQIVVLNAGGQYCHLIARRIRELGVHAVVGDIGKPAPELAAARGIIISGGPASVVEPTSPSVDPRIYALGVPILGICYGHQLMARDLHGRVEPGVTKEYGHSSLHAGDCLLFRSVPKRELRVWMSHGDTVVDIPSGFTIVGETDDCKVAAMEDRGRRFFGLQFIRRWSTQTTAARSSGASSSTSAGPRRTGTLARGSSRCWPASGRPRATARSSSSSAAAWTPP